MPVVIINASTKLALPNWLNKTITRQIASDPLVRAGVATDAIDANLSNGECFNIIAKNMVNTMLQNGSNATISSNKETAINSIIGFPLLRYVNIVMKISKILLDFSLFSLYITSCKITKNGRENQIIF